MRKSLWLLLFITSAAGYGYSENRKSSAAFRKEAVETAFQNNNDSLPNILLVGNAHIDLAYRWDWNETVARVIPETFRGVLRMMDKVPGLTFSQSQMAAYEAVMREDPFLFRDIRKRIEDGSWSVTGGQWSEPDEMMAGGESFIRQFLLGNEFNEKYLAIKPVNIAWTPDAFSGHAASLPKIYKGCGIEYYTFMRAAPTGKRVFWWESSDGSRILAYNLPTPYNARLTSKPLLSDINDWMKIVHYPSAMILYGEGDHGGGPRDTDMEALKSLKANPLCPPLAYSTPEKFYASLTASGRQWPTFVGEMGVPLPDKQQEAVVQSTEGPAIGTTNRAASANNESLNTWRGTYTSQVCIKKLNRDAENQLNTSEKFAVIGSMLQAKPFHPRMNFREAWKILLRNQFHDTLAGTIVGYAADNSVSELKGVLSESDRLLNFGLEVIGSRINTNGVETPLIVYNPLSWSRIGIVKANIRFVTPVIQINITEKSGKDVNFHVDSISTNKCSYFVSLLAENIPAIGYRMFSVHQGQAPTNHQGVAVSKNSAENRYFKVSWDNTGLTSVFDKLLAKEVLSGKGNVLKLMEESGTSSWRLAINGKVCPITSVKGAEIIENTPLRCVVQWVDASKESLFTRKMILEKDVPQVKFSISTNWSDHDKCLKVVFPVEVKKGTATYEIPYGYIERPLTNLDNPAQNWVDLSAKEWGVSLLNNGRYGFVIDEGEINMSVVRGARDMDARMDQGVQEVSYAIVSHKGDWRDGDIVRKALELNQPMVSLQESSHDTGLGGWTGVFTLPEEYSFFGIETKNAILSAVKLVQGDWSPQNTVVRVIETEGKDGPVTVKLPAKPTSIVESNHIEKPLGQQPEIKIGEKEFTFQMKHDQIRTFIIQF